MPGPVFKKPDAASPAVDAISNISRINTESAQARAKTARETSNQVREGLRLQREGIIEETKRKGAGIFGTLKQDITGETPAAARAKQAQGSAFARNAQAQGALDQQALGFERDAALAPYRGKLATIKAEQEAAQAVRENRSLALREQNLVLSTLRETRLARIQSRADALDRMGTQDVSAAMEALNASGGDSLIQTDPHSGMEIMISRGQLEDRQAQIQKRNTDLEVNQLLLESNRLDLVQQREDDVLNHLSFEELRAVVDNDGFFEDPETGTMHKFDTQTAVAKMTSLEESRATRFQRELQEPELAMLADKTQEAATRIGLVDDRIQSAFNGQAPLEARDNLAKAVSNIENLNRAGEIIAASEGDLTPSDKKQLEAEIDSAEKSTRAAIRESAKAFSNGDSNMESFVSSHIEGTAISPKVTADAFATFGLNPSITTELSNPATQAALQKYQESVLEVGNKELANAGEPLEAGFATVLAALDKRSPASKEAVKAKAQENAANSYADTVSDSLLQLPNEILADPRLLVEGRLHPVSQVNLRGAFAQATAIMTQRADREDRTTLNTSDEQVFFQALASTLAQQTVPGDKFNTALEAYMDFTSQESFQEVVRDILHQGRDGTFADGAASRLFTGTAAERYQASLDSVITAGARMQSEQQSIADKSKVAYNNNGERRADAILAALVPTGVLTEDEATALKVGVVNRVRTSYFTSGDDPNLAQAKASGPVNVREFEDSLMHVKFDDPQLESIRKRVVPKWRDVAPGIDNVFKLTNVQSSLFSEE